VWVADEYAAADGSRYIPAAIEDDVVFTGACRCGAVQYTSSAPPSDITLCHCRACQQLSGSAYLPFIGIPKAALKYAESSALKTLKTLKLSDVAERTFCSACGTPITMTYSFEENEISITMGSIDTNTFTCESPKVKNHIFLSEKAPWVVLPEDGAERWGTCEFAHLLASAKHD
jgi:hypothetical protein